MIALVMVACTDGRRQPTSLPTSAQVHAWTLRTMHDELARTGVLRMADGRQMRVDRVHFDADGSLVLGSGESLESVVMTSTGPSGESTLTARQARIRIVDGFLEMHFVETKTMGPHGPKGAVATTKETTSRFPVPTLPDR